MYFPPCGGHGPAGEGAEGSAAASALFVFIIFYSSSFIAQDSKASLEFLKTAGENQQYLLKNCSQIRKLISGMVAWGM